MKIQPPARSDRRRTAQARAISQGGKRPERTFGPNAGRFLKIFAAVTAVAFSTAACTSEKTDPPATRACDYTEGSTEAKLVHQLLGTEQYITTLRTDSDLTEKMTERLQQWHPGETEYTFSPCSLSPKTDRSTALRVEFYWTSRSSPSKWEYPSNDTSYYNFHGIPGESNEVLSRILVPCSLPGKTSAPSQRVLLGARASNTAYTGPRENQKASNGQIEFLYLMTRKATDILGCENNPLKDAPSVKAYSTPEEASAAEG